MGRLLAGLWQYSVVTFCEGTTDRAGAGPMRRGEGAGLPVLTPNQPSDPALGSFPSRREREDEHGSALIGVGVFAIMAVALLLVFGVPSTSAREKRGEDAVSSNCRLFRTRGA